MTGIPNDDDIRALCEKATPGPWFPYPYLADARFIAAARSLVPALLDRALAAEDALEDKTAAYDEMKWFVGQFADQRDAARAERDALATQLAQVRGQIAADIRALATSECGERASRRENPEHWAEVDRDIPPQPHYPDGHPHYPCEGCDAAAAADESFKIAADVAAGDAPKEQQR